MVSINVFIVLLVGITQTWSAVWNPWGETENFCTTVTEKLDCGYIGIDKIKCEEGKGCCWERSDDKSVPWCFFKGVAPTCQPTYYREDCGYPGIDQYECEHKGCCWTPEQTQPVAWCYHKSTTAPTDVCNPEWANRHDCGFYGIDQETCEKKGCCWSPKDNEPWCFYKHANPPVKR